MKLLKTILRKDPMPLEGKTITREAVRGIIFDSSNLLMVYSLKNGDYKFPGGGMDGRETHAETLRREIAEECGATLSAIERPFGKVLEYDIPLEPEYDVFRMTSYYYICRVTGSFGAQKLDAYEQDLGFEARWVPLETAIRVNEALLRGSLLEVPRWTARELFVLGLIKELC